MRADRINVLPGLPASADDDNPHAEPSCRGLQARA